jgi:hypothetical protein
MKGGNKKRKHLQDEKLLDGLADEGEGGDVVERRPAVRVL